MIAETAIVCGTTVALYAMRLYEAREDRQRATLLATVAVSQERIDALVARVEAGERALDLERSRVTSALARR